MAIPTSKKLSALCGDIRTTLVPILRAKNSLSIPKFSLKIYSISVERPKIQMRIEKKLTTPELWKKFLDELQDECLFVFFRPRRDLAPSGRAFFHPLFSNQNKIFKLILLGFPIRIAEQINFFLNHSLHSVSRFGHNFSRVDDIALIMGKLAKNRVERNPHIRINVETDNAPLYGFSHLILHPIAGAVKNKRRIWTKIWVFSR